MPAWTPSVAALRHLGPETSLGTYAIRPPKGYGGRQGQQMGSVPITIYRWDGVPRADGSGTVFSVHVAQFSGGPTDTSGLSRSIQQLAESNRQNHSDYFVSPVQQGTVNGLPFARVYWKGVFSPKDTRSHGFFYATGDAGTQISIHGTDSEPYSKDTWRSARRLR